MNTSELVKEIATGHNKMFKAGMQQGRIQAFQEIVSFIKSKLEEIENERKN